MDNTKQVKISLWPVSNVFDYGTLNVSLSSRVDLLNLKRIIVYAKTKGSAGFPILSYLVWRHIACSHLQLPENLAWLYFDTYALLCDIGAERRYRYDQQLLKISRNGEIASFLERHKDSRKVDCLKFVVLLYLQRYNLVGRKSAVYSMEEWPSTSKTSESKSYRRKARNEESHLQFVNLHLEEIMYVLSATDAKESLHEPEWSVECVAALGFIIEGSIDKNRSIQPLEDILLSSSAIKEECGFKSTTQSFNSKLLVRFLKAHLKLNPFIGENCLTYGVILNNERISTTIDTNRKRSVMTANGNFASKSRKLVIISHLYRTTVIESSNHYEDAEVKLHRCSSSFIYILSPLKCVSITKCKNTTIALAAVETTVILDSCENVRITTACRRFVISNSTNTICHLLVNYNPILLSGNKNIQFAPFNTNFPNLDNILRQAGLIFGKNCWNSPIIPSLTNCSNVTNIEKSKDNVYSLLPPESFYLLNVPVMTTAILDSPLNDAVFALPVEYQNELDRRSRSLDEWKYITQKAELQENEKKILQNFVENQFQTWLKRTGTKQEIDQLLDLSTSAPTL
ncbi:hypothetical protein GJ496_001341 [Pomphorhynchus laevis]|nr:hypothetical protein GJ496_001341 [Pomphorhynchus laevis]